VLDWCVQVAGFSDTADRMMHDGRCDSRRLRREVDDVKRKWDEFHRAIAEYRAALDDSAKFFEQMDNVRRHSLVWAWLRMQIMSVWAGHTHTPV